jgi:energy-coupling factor transport system substrate-specific component
MLGVLMLCSKLIMELAPNIHLLGMFVMSFTLVYRKKALIPIYLFVLLLGVYYGFPYHWWGGYLYIWTILWGVTMLLPKKMPPLVAPVVYMAVCGLHGLLFGTLFAPYNSLVFGLSFDKTLAWIAYGLPYDVLHMVGNLAAGVLIVPMQKLLLRLETKYQK